MKNFVLLGILLVTNTAFAIDNQGILNRYSVSGIISGTKGKNVAIIKDQQTNKSLTVEVGQVIDSTTNLQVKSIVGKSVLLSDGKVDTSIGYAAPRLSTTPEKTSDEEKTQMEEAQVQNFLDNLAENHDFNIDDEEFEEIEEDESQTLSDRAYELLQQKIRSKAPYIIDSSYAKDVNVEKDKKAEDAKPMVLDNLKKEEESKQFP